MKQIPGVEIPNAAQMSRVERLEAVFSHIANFYIENYSNELEVARAIHDEENKKRLHVQISTIRHLQDVFQMAKAYATDEGWQDEERDN